MSLPRPAQSELIGKKARRAACHRMAVDAMAQASVLDQRSKDKRNGKQEDAREPNLSPIGISQVQGLSQAEQFGFFQAAAEFADAAPWRLLKQTRFRQYGCSFRSSFDQAHSVTYRDRPLGLFDTVQLCELTSEAGQKLNGLCGELVPPMPYPGDAVTPLRWSVRLFHDGRIVKAKPANMTRAADADEFVVKVCGGDGGSFGVAVYKSWSACWQHNQQTHVHGELPPSENGLFVLEVVYVHSDEPHFMAILEADEALRRQLCAPRPKPMANGVNSFPLVFGKSETGQSVTRRESLMLEAALFSAARFLHQLSERPMPPPPYFCPTSFQPLEADLEIIIKTAARGNTSRKVKRRPQERAVQIRCAFPSGNLHAAHHKWCSCPGIVRRFAERPNSVRTVNEAIAYHRNELEKREVAVGDSWQAACTRGDMHGFAHMFGLANALWEAEGTANVDEAITIAQQLLEAQPSDTNQVRSFLLDLFLEVGRWGEAIKLLGRFPDDCSEDWVWNEVLVSLKGRGADSSVAKAALTRAVQLNSHVLPLLLGDDYVNEDEIRDSNKYCMLQSTTVNGDGTKVVTGCRTGAIRYYHTSSKYWYQDVSSLEFLRAHEAESTVKNSKHAGLKLEQNGTNPKKSITRLICAQCSQPSEGTTFMKCPCDGKTHYCSKECQKKHWKVHKSEHERILAHKQGHAATLACETSALSQYEHRSWTRLTMQQRSDLREFHEKHGCTVPWPVSCETPAMLISPHFSFMRAHPSMLMKAGAVELPSFRMAYNGDTDSSCHGKIFPSGQRALMLTENRSLDALVDLESHSEAKHVVSEYFKRVIPHSMGTPMRFCLVGEVTYTAYCKMSLAHFYSAGNPEWHGKFFDWPGFEAVVTCPGTGEVVEPDQTRLHLLVCHQAHATMRTSGSINACTRIFPRILTLEGYKKLMGDSPAGAPNRCVTIAGVTMEVYPEALRQLITGMQCTPTHPRTLSKTWEAFHDAGRYLAYERYCENEQRNTAELTGASFKGPTRGREFG